MKMHAASSLLAVACILIGLLAGLWLLRSVSPSPWHTRVRAFLVPPLLLLCLAETAVKVFFADQHIWNEIRLARTFGLYRGLPFYPGKDATGPIIGTLHTPLSHILYWPATLAPDPVNGVRIGVLISVLLLLASLIAVHRLAVHQPAAALHSTPGPPLNAFTVIFAIELFWLGVLNTNIMMCVFAIHADPIGIACGAFAAGLLLLRPIDARRLLLSALFATLSVMAKQTFATLPLALLLFVFLAEGRRIALRYFLYLAGWSILAIAALLSAFRPARDVYFNLLTLSSHRPPQPVVAMLPHLHDRPAIIANRLYHVVGHALHHGSEGYVFATFVLLLVIWCALQLRSDIFRQSRTQIRTQSLGQPGSLYQLADGQRWLVFIFIAAGLFPLLFKASITRGGDANHLAIAEFFLLLALTTSVLQASFSAKPSALWLHLVTFGLVLLFSYHSIYQFKSAFRHGPTMTAQAAAYARAHPGLVYFPWNPLSSIYAERRFYTFDHSIEDREIAGYPPSPDQYASGIPPDVTYIAMDPGTITIVEVSDSLNHYLTPGWTRFYDPDLPLFAVFRRTNDLHLVPPQEPQALHPSK